MDCSFSFPGSNECNEIVLPSANVVIVATDVSCFGSSGRCWPAC